MLVIKARAPSQVVRGPRTRFYFSTDDDGGSLLKFFFGSRVLGTGQEYLAVMASNARKVPMPVADWFVKKGFEHVQDVFRKTIEDGVERGGSFAAYYKGELVVNLWGGFSDEGTRRPWNYNTTSNFYSTTKSPCAVVMAHLMDKGLVDYGQPVCSYWPEFAQNGKEKITLKHILSMKAGLPTFSDQYKLNMMRDDPLALECMLAKQKPWNLGDAAAYSPIVIGLYLDQIVKRVDPQKRGLAEYFRTEIAEPFGIDLQIGLPKSDFWRKTRQVVVLDKVKYEKYKAHIMTNSNVSLELALTLKTQPSDLLKNYVMNQPDFAELPSGSSHGVGTAAGMAKFHSILANGGSLRDGRRLLSEDTVQMLQVPLHLGPEKSHGIDFFYSCGMELLPVLEGDELHYNIGHGGFGGQFAAADVKHNTAWAYCTNYLDPTLMMTGNTKWNILEKALFDCVFALEGIAVERKHVDNSAQLQKTLQRKKSKL